ncbi:hypothetical protein [Rothia sp. HMSC036D11]|uniref:hypothetical protein n=1 Tax=Rothia sp. HMSC036D11 TaxID=1739462 RepID=UPI000A98E9B3|nr:hypothetical protein [Rothia sp. HMSC036D11]
MSNKKQSDVKQPGWLCKACLWLARIFLGLLVIAISYCICSPYLYPEQRTVNNDHTRLGWYLIGLAVICGLVLRWPKITTSSPKKYFIARVLAAGVTGGVFAFLLPVAVKSTTTGVGGLRHSILLATGGFIAILTLGETRRKNDNDKLKNDQEKKKNDRDHRRQVRAERRERYTKAVEQLGDEKASVRMGGVYTLVGLVDEWLEDESIEKYKDRLKEGQVIINNLCAYIRSPFTLASQHGKFSQNKIKSKNKFKKFIRKYIQQNFYINKANFQAEVDVRLSIIKEIHDRLKGPEENTPGAWSDFEYDFSGSTFFYPVDFTNSYYKKPVNFRNSTYHSRLTSRTPPTRVELISVAPPTRVELISSVLPTRKELTSRTLSTRKELTSAALPTRVGLISSVLPTRKELTCVAPPTRKELTSAALPTRKKLTCVAPFISGLTSAVPSTRVGLISVAPPTRIGLTSAVPSTRVGLTSAVPFFIVKLILVKTDTAKSLLVLQTAPLNFMTRQTIKLPSSAHIIMISQ